MALSAQATAQLNEAFGAYLGRVRSDEAAGLAATHGPVAWFTGLLGTDSTGSAVASSAHGSLVLYTALLGRRVKLENDDQARELLLVVEGELGRPGLWSTVLQLSPVGAAAAVARDSARQLVSPSLWPWWLWGVGGVAVLAVLGPYLGLLRRKP